MIENSETFWTSKSYKITVLNIILRVLLKNQ